MSNKRFTALPEKVAIDSGDYLAVDNISGGTKKYQANKIFTELGELESDIADLNSALEKLYYANTDSSIWEMGGFVTQDGTTFSTNTRFRSKGYITGAVGVKLINGYSAIIFAWNSSNTYMGEWTGTGYTKDPASLVWHTGTVIFDEINPAYKYKIAVRNPSNTTITLAENANVLLLRVNSNQVVNTNSEMAGTITDNVTVLKNSSTFGDGGTCFFEKTTESQWSIPRTDGSYVRPLPGQGNLFTQKINVKTLLNTINGYIGNSSLTYGSDNTLFDSTCTDEIDCSAFVNAILNCITYNNSRYNLGSSASNKRLFGGYGNTLNERMYSGQLASWFAQRKQLYTIPSDMAKLTRLLQPGDLLFFGGDSDTDKIYGIGHVVIVLASLYPTYYKAIIAQAGGAPNADNLNTTVGKISIAHLETSFNAGKVKAWARPTYNIDYMSETPGLDKMLGGSYYFDTAFIPGVFLDTSGNVSYSGSWSGDPVMYNVIPGKSIKNTSSLLGRIAFYDADKTFIRRVDISANASVTVDNTAHYARFNTNTTLLSTALQSKFMMS